MERSQINSIMRMSDSFIRSFGYQLPPFAYYTPDDMRNKYNEISRILDSRLGWDITDYGRGRFDELGLFLFTVRNGNQEDLRNGCGMLYAEKIMISKKEQLSPLHRHAIKAEDIINRGGGNLVIELYQSDENLKPDREAVVEVPCDGVLRRVAAGGKIALKPGESVTLLPGIWHAFWAEKADVLIGEVSTVNDDETDNYFNEPIGRFAEIEEDEPPLHLLVSDYPKFMAAQASA